MVFLLVFYCFVLFQGTAAWLSTIPFDPSCGSVCSHGSRVAALGSGALGSKRSCCSAPTPSIFFHVVPVATDPSRLCSLLSPCWGGVRLAAYILLAGGVARQRGWPATV